MGKSWTRKAASKLYLTPRTDTLVGMTHTRRKSLVTILLACLLPLAMVGCDVSSSIHLLGIVADAASVAVPIALSATGLDPATKAAIAQYLAAVAQGVSQTSYLIDSSPGHKVDAKLAAQIVQIFANITLRVGTAQLPPAVAIALRAVVDALAAFLGTLPPLPPQGLAAGTPPPLGAFKPFRISGRDRAAVAAAKMKADTAVQAIRAAGY